MTDESRVAFDEMANCVKTQYGKYCVNSTRENEQHCVDGAHTLGENMAGKLRGEAAAALKSAAAFFFRQRGHTDRLQRVSSVRRLAWRRSDATRPDCRPIQQRSALFYVRRRRFGLFTRPPKQTAAICRTFARTWCTKIDDAADWDWKNEHSPSVYRILGTMRNFAGGSGVGDRR